MEARNCARCGKVFTYIGNRICPDCVRREDDEFKLVKEYIDEHRASQLDEVVNETGVSMKRIMKFLREGRLEIAKGAHSILVCEKCGEPISKGKFCDQCRLKISGGIQEMFKAENEKAAKEIETRVFGKMHLSKKL